jgi:hypothetical protein
VATAQSGVSVRLCMIQQFSLCITTTVLVSALAVASLGSSVFGGSSTLSIDLIYMEGSTHHRTTRSITAVLQLPGIMLISSASCFQFASATASTCSSASAE